MEAKDLQYAIWHWCRCKAIPLIVPNSGLLMRGEQDMLAVTRSGYAWEFEIKISHADFRADFKKRTGYGRNAVYKHRLLREPVRDDLVPRQFWFVVPEELVEVVQPELPDHAGLLGCKRRAVHLHPWLWRVRQAPTIDHARKLEITHYQKLYTSLSYRFWDVWRAHYCQNQKPLSVRTDDK